MRKPQQWFLGHYQKKNYHYTIIVSQSVHHTAWVFSKDLDLVNKYRWYYKDGYAITSIHYKRVKMHHLILGKPPKGLEVDHINENRMDNRRENLRMVSHSVNLHNTISKGVRKHGKVWEANICLNYKKYFKSFKTINQAKKWREQMKNNYLLTVQ